MKNSSNFTKKLLLLFMVLAIGFIGGLLGNLTSSKLSTNSSTTTKVNQVTTAYKNTNSTTQAVSKVKIIHKIVCFEITIQIITMIILNK